MDTIIKFFLYFTLGVMLIGLLANIIIYGGLLYLAYFVGKKIFLFIKEQRANQQIIEETKAYSDTIEYKMTKLLELSGNYIEAPAVRHAYRKKTDLSLQDKWHQFLDLRAKLELNNTSTSKAEAVLHVMCDEIIARIESVDVELTAPVKKEFISFIVVVIRIFVEDKVRLIVFKRRNRFDIFIVLFNVKLFVITPKFNPAIKVKANAVFCVFKFFV